MRIQFVFMLIALLLVRSLSATHGYVLPGYGTKSIGMGGVAVAYPQDSIISATNPAGMTFLCDRFDIGAKWFNPNRKYSYTNFEGDDITAGQKHFLIPHLGMVYHAPGRGPTFGVSIYGNGGLNTNYPRNNPVFGEGVNGIDYLQLVIAPTVSGCIKTGCATHAVGVSMLFAGQQLKARGLQNFAMMMLSRAPNDVTNNGYDVSLGLGVRFGWMMKIANLGAIGVAYSPRIHMSKLEKYQGLLADHGTLDIPAVFSAGLAVPLFCQNAHFAFDFQRVWFHSVAAIGNSIQNFFQGNPLGSENGPGFGWKNLNIYKFGIDYGFSCWQVRAGWSFSPVVYDKTQVDFNILAPAVTKDHACIGATFCLWNGLSIDLAYNYVLENSVQGESVFGLGLVRETMNQHLVELNVGYKY